MSYNWKPAFEHKDVVITDENLLLNDFLKVKQFNFNINLFAGGVSKQFTRSVLLKSPAAALLPYNPVTDTVILIEQFRVGALNKSHNVSPWILEPIAGIIESGDTAAATAIRESKEEAGLKITKLELISNYLVSSGTTDEFASIFCGMFTESSSKQLHGLTNEDEDIKSHEMLVAEALELMERGMIYTASGIIALQWLQNNKDYLKNKWLKK